MYHFSKLPRHARLVRLSVSSPKWPSALESIITAYLKDVNKLLHMYVHMQQADNLTQTICLGDAQYFFARRVGRVVE